MSKEKYAVGHQKKIPTIRNKPASLGALVNALVAASEILVGSGKSAAPKPMKCRRKTLR